MKHIRHFFAALLTIAAWVTTQSALAQTFTIDASHDDSTNKTTFIIKRTGSSLPQQTINYRTVNLSAYAGQHYTAVSGSYTFLADEKNTTVVVTENTSSANAYLYQNGTERSYRLEVLDVNGFELAYKDHPITIGTSVPISGAFGIKDVTIQTAEYTADDRGYDKNGYKSVSSSNYFDNAAPKGYFQFIGAQLRMTLSFDAKENDDAYEYLQLLVDNTSTCDNRSGSSNGDPGNISLSKYMAGFEMNTGAKDDTYRSYTFPVLSVGNNAGATDPWGYGTKWPLKMQKFNGNRADDGRIIIPTGFNTLVLRLNASGGSGSDEWAAKNVKAHIQAVDATKPTLYNNSISGITVSGGPYVKGNTFYISVPFSEIVHISGSSKQLETSWGNVTYFSGDYSNVITFKGTITANAGTTLAITKINNSLFNDLAGNDYQSTTSSFNKTFNGITCTESYTLAATNTQFTGFESEYAVSNAAIEPHPTVYFYKGIVNSANRVTLTEGTHYTLTWADNTAPGTGTVSATGIGIYTGSSSTTFTLRWATYTVHFDTNGGGGEMSNQAFTYNTAHTLTANAFTRIGYTFAGWNTAADGSGTGYADGQEVSNLTATNGATFDLYAQWTPITYTITYDLAGGTVATANPENYNIESEAITLVNPTRTGYTFAGWTGTGLSEPTMEVTIPKGSIEARSYTATWTPITYALTYDLAGGTVATANPENYNIESAAITLVNPTRTGYTFAGWTGTGLSEPTMEVTIPNGSIEARSYTATWTPITYALRLHHNDGTDNYTDMTLIYDQAQNIQSFSHEGCIFEGWSTTADGAVVYADGQEVINLTATPGATIDLYAQWTDFWGMAGGANGSEEHPYIITTTAGLDFLAQNVNGGNEYPNTYFKLGADITYPHTTDWDDANSTENNYTAIGNSSKAFCGIFDGDGHTVSGIRINKPSDRYQGLFGLVDGATVKNVTLADARITGYSNVGGISGQMNGNATIENCLVLNTAITANSYRGAVVGYRSNGTLNNNHYRNCTVNGNTTGVGCDGSDRDGARSVHALTLTAGITAMGESVVIDGVTYYASNTTITLTYSGEVPVGYHILYFVNGSSIIGNTFTMPAEDVIVSADVKIAYTLRLHHNDGTDEYTDMTLIYDQAQNIQSVSRTGYVFEGWSTTADGAVVYADGQEVINLTTTPGATIDLYAQWTDVWGMAGGANGSEEHPYIITTTAGLDLLAQNVNSGSNEYPNTYFKLGADIAYDPNVLDANGENYTAIGTSEKAFCGIFDGDGHTVSGIRINKPSKDYQGLFGRVYGATVKNVTLNDARITGYSNVGGISGQMNGNSTIENCLVLNTAITANSSRGAVVGYRWNGTLNNNHYRNCTVNGNTTGVGCNGSDRDGARSVHSLTLTAGITAMGESVVIDGVTYYASNTTVTLAYSGSVPVGYTFDGYFVNGLPIDGNTFTMPAADAAVSAWQVAYFDAADNSDAIDNLNGEMVDVELSGRTLYRDGDWNTLCLPFSLTAEQVAASPLAGCTLMTLDTDAGSYEHITGFENNTLYLNFKTATSIEAGTPYIVKGEPDQPDLTISSESDWNTFCTNVNNGTSYSGMTVRLAVDISVSRMVGTYNYPFKGTFDGDGHTLTVTLNNNGDTGTDDRYNGVAPFRFTYGATIKNLHVGGTITTSTRKFAAGIVGMTKDGTNNIQNCRVSAEIYSTINGDGTHGGFVGKACGTVNISNCLFDGVLTTDEGNITNSCGGFVGWRDDPCSLSISNSLYSPAEIPSGKYAIGTDNSCTFTRNNNNCVSDCYYTETLGEAQGTDASAMSNSELLTALGDGWEISNGKVVPTMKSNILNPFFVGVTIDNENPEDQKAVSQDGCVTFVGSYNPVTLTGGDRSVLYLGSNNNLYFPAADRTMGAFRAYFQLDLDAASSPVKAFVLNFNDDDATSLNEELRMKSEEFATDREWYDLSGRKLSGKPGKRGIYIRDGKKIILK